MTKKIKKRMIKALAEEDLKELRSNLKIEDDLYSKAETFLYLFYLSVFNQIVDVDFNAVKNNDNSIASKKMITETSELRSDAVDYMELLAETNKDILIIIQCLTVNKTALKTENKMMYSFFKDILWKGGIKANLYSQLPNCLFIYAQINMIIKETLNQVQLKTLK